ncbi:MAG: hypothetical protein H6738_17395 [Alphaproteobacteria bacterium]|nr:hypothetical protein [Alphaproteobacteria bacterium]MCB9698559.1 hypothetical protein [Alphaproteobacteria bacterium]
MSKLWLLPIVATGAALAGTVLPSSTEELPVVEVYDLAHLDVGEAEYSLRMLYATPQGEPPALTTRAMHGQLVIRATPAVHDQVRALLDEVDR